MEEPARIDVLVVGGGPAGLAAALWLGRHRLTTLVADLGEQRNRFVEASFGYLGFDTANPTDLIDAGRAELARYPSVELRTTGVRAEPFGASDLTAIELYLAWRANGLKVETPAVRP